MRKVNNTAMATDTFGEAIVKHLLEGERVAVPNLGYLEQKTLGSRKTVLFKPLKPQDSLMKELSSKDETFSSLLYTNISALLLESKQVSIPSLGVFHPLKNEDGSLRVSFAPSPVLRRQLNGESEAEFIPPEVETGHVVSAKEEKPEKQPVEAEVKQIDAAQKKEAVLLVNKKEMSIVDTRKKVARSKWQITGAALIVLIIIVWIMIAVSHTNSSDKSFIQNRVDEKAILSLPALAARQYGNPIFWVYIYEANRDKLQSPINIPAGVTLVVPDLADSQIDGKDSLEIRKAQALSNLILEQKK